MSQAHSGEPVPENTRPASGFGQTGFGQPGLGQAGFGQPPLVRRPRDGRAVAMAVSGVVALLLALAAIILPAPYVVESPGPTLNTLGSDKDTKIISITGRQSYPANGQLDMVTVYVNGGPQSSVNLFEAYRSWMDPKQAVYPVELVYPASATKDQITSQNAADMTNSQDAARAAALGLLGIDYQQELLVGSVPEGSASTGKLQANDRLQSIDGKPITALSVVQEVLAAGQGAPVTIGVLRDGAAQDVVVTPAKADDGRFLLGVLLKYSYVFPFDIKISLENVGGPSAGMMFALGIIDTLTPGDLTGGKHFAGTGTIDAAGNVGPIGGIVQKMYGARSAGATVFLAPAANCNEVVGKVPDGLQVVRVATLKEAYDAVKTIASGQDSSALPTCTAR